MLNLPRLRAPYIRPVEDVELYAAELAGACDLLGQAGAASGDDRIMLMDLAADAWHEARKAANIQGFAFVIERLIPIENEALVQSGVGVEAYLQLSQVYNGKQMGKIRAALGRLGA